MATKVMKVTKEDVLSTASAMIEDVEYATSLEVKETLRRDGFWATQEVVGKFLRELAKEGKLTFTHVKLPNTKFGYYRMYTLAAPVVVEPKTGHDFDSNNVCKNDGCGISSPAATAFGWNKCDGSAEIADAKARLNIGTFRVTHYNGLYVGVYKEVTRGQAKWLWVKTFGFPFFAARTVRLDK